MKTDGVLALPQPSKSGRTLSPDVIDLIKGMYEDDQFSRMCPGKKDFMSVRMDGARVLKQKRLLLINLKELYVQFKEQHPDHNVGF